MSKVESQEGQPIYGWVKNSIGTWDRLRFAQPGPVLAWSDHTNSWIECRLVPVADTIGAVRDEDGNLVGFMQGTGTSWDRPRDRKQEAEGAQQVENEKNDGSSWPRNDPDQKGLLG